MDNVRELDIGQPLLDEKTRAMYTMHAHRENEARHGRLRYLTKLSEKEAGAVKALRELIAKACKYTGIDVDNRAMVCTPCAGDHGAITSWVITIEGSPPRGTLFVKINGSQAYIMGDAGRRTGDKQLRVVQTFIVAVLGGTSPRMIESVPPVIIAEHMK